jgi:hypothetical protein
VGLERALRSLDHGSVDWILTAAVTVIAWKPTGLTHRLAAVPDDHLRATFGSSASAVAILAGFTVSTTFYFATSDAPTLESFRERFGRRINRTLVGSFVSLVVAVFGLITAILTAPKPVCAFCFIAAMTITLFKLFRISFFAYSMLKARYRDTRHRPVVIEDQGNL